MVKAEGGQREPDEDVVSLTALTERTGLSARTIRFYQTRGLIPPPLRRGRAGYYDAGHIARLELVQEMQKLGFTLGAIERYLSELPEDATPDEVALVRTMIAPWQADLPVEMTKAELDARCGRALSEDDIATLHALGLVRHRRTSYLVSESQLSNGLRLLELGFPREVALASAAVYQDHGEQMAKELWDVISHQLAPLYSDAEPAHFREIMLRLRPLSIGGLVSAYETALGREAFGGPKRP